MSNLKIEPFYDPATSTLSYLPLALKGYCVRAQLLPSVQVNIDAGRLPPVEASGRRYLRIPLELTAKEAP